MASVELLGICKSFGEVKVLDDVTIDVPDGSFVVLVGPSGCGKSTLLRSLAGLEEITSGDILIGGESVVRLPAKDRDIAMVFQSYALYPHMTVAENMGFSLRLRGVKRADVESAVNRAAASLNLTEYLHRLPRELSGGQRQRVAMGRAIVRNPKVFLFDEPLSNLDAKLRVQMRKEIKELHQRLRSTMIYVTHDQVEAMTLADRIVVLQGGRIEQIGAPLDLYHEPRNVFVAQFIGSPAMNILQGQVQQGVLRLPDGISWSHSAFDSLHGRAVTVGVRPEHLDICDERQDALTVHVRLVENTGSETLLTAECGRSRLQLICREHDAGGGTVRSHSFRAGETLHVAARRVHLFDAESGERIEAQAESCAA